MRAGRAPIVDGQAPTLPADLLSRGIEVQGVTEIRRDSVTVDADPGAAAALHARLDAWHTTAWGRP